MKGQNSKDQPNFKLTQFARPIRPPASPARFARPLRPPASPTRFARLHFPPIRLARICFLFGLLAFGL